MEYRWKGSTSTGRFTSNVVGQHNKEALLLEQQLCIGLHSHTHIKDLYLFLRMAITCSTLQKMQNIKHKGRRKHIPFIIHSRYTYSHTYRIMLSGFSTNNLWLFHYENQVWEFRPNVTFLFNPTLLYICGVIKPAKSTYLSTLIYAELKS